MRAHSDTLQCIDIGTAVQLANRPGVYVDGITTHGSRKRDRALEFQLRNYHSRRHVNTGTHGAGEDGAASWDDYGHVLAVLFDLDPLSVIGPYAGVADFHRQTDDKYRRPTPTPAEA